MNLNNKSILAEKLRVRGMNRTRNLDDYNKQLGLDIQKMAYQCVNNNGTFTWYDLCCGYFIAGNELLKRTSDIANKINVRGIDVDARDRNIICANTVTFQLPPDVNLITCLQGVNYIQTYLRKGADAINNWNSSLKEGAILAFDVAINHVNVRGKDISDYLKNISEYDVDVFPTPTRENTHNTIKIYGRDKSCQVPIKRYSFVSQN